MRRADLIIGGLLFLMGCGLSTYAIITSVGSVRTPGPGFFAFLIGGGLMILSAMIFLKAWQLPKPSSAQRGSEVLHWRNIVFFSFGLGAYAYALEHLGYLVATPLFMIFLFRAIYPPRRWWVSILGGIGATVISYVVFYTWFKVDLPIGIFGV